MTSSIGRKLYEMLNPQDPSACANPATWEQTDEDFRDHYERVARQFSVEDKPRSSSPYGFNCRDCLFSSLPHTGSVECRRAAPTPYFEPNGGVSNIRPRVGQYYWCGEYVHWRSQRAQQLIEERSDTATAETISDSLTPKEATE